MRIRHRLDAPALEEIKDKVLDHRLTPVIVMAFATIFAVHMSKKDTKIVINVNTTGYPD